MRRMTVFAGFMTAVLVSTLIASAQPPARPLDLTAAQFDALRQIEAQPPHAAILEVHASFASNREARLMAKLIADDISTGATQFGWPAALVTILICAAPL